MLRFSNFLKLVFLCVCGLSLTTCTKDLSFDFNDSDKKLVINGAFAANQHFKIALTTSRNILDANSEIEQVSDAFVVIKNAEGKILEVLSEHNDLGLYVSSDSLKAFQGHTYQLEVTHPYWKGVVFTARSSAPEISNLSLIDTTHTTINNSPALKVGVLIDDLMNLDDRYVFEVELKEMKVLAPLKIDNNVETEVKIFGDRDQPTRLFLDDKSFNGTQKTLDFFTTKGIPNSNSDDGSAERSTEIRMLNVSDELYEYYKSLEEYQLAQKTIGSGNSSAVRVYSNIKRSGANTGLGIFAGYNVKSLSYSY